MWKTSLVAGGMCLFLSAGLLLTAGKVAGAQQAAANDSPLEIFNQRILPIFRSPEPSSCVQCHLAGVDLKNYILPSSEKTFLSLRDQGLVDLDHPEKSKILTLITMGDKDLDQGARLIHEKTRRAEYEAFAAWIQACCDDPRLRNVAPLAASEQARPPRPDGVIRHARKSRIVDSFVRNVWSQRMRCFPCHTPHEIDPNNPKHQAAVKTRKQFEQNYGSEIANRLDIFKATPEATLQYLIERSQQPTGDDLPLLNLDDPLRSLIVLKPLSKLPAKQADGSLAAPSSTEPVTHLGGLKMHKDDHSYKAFLAWIKDYANVVGDRYAHVDDLPADNWIATQKILKLMNAPESWSVGVPVQLVLYSWKEDQDQWDEEPAAFTQGTVTPRRLVMGAMFRLSGKPEDVLAGGRYLVRIYVDRKNRLAQDPTLMLSDEDFAGEVEIKKSRWRDGFKQAVPLSAAELQHPSTK